MVQPPIRTRYNPGDIPAIMNAALLDAEAALDDIGSVSPERRTLSNTLLELETVLTEFADISAPLTVMGYVYPDKQVAEEGMEAEEKAKQFLIALFSRRDLYAAIKTARPETTEQKRLLEFTLREFRKNGLDLPEEKLNQVRALKESVASLESKFSANLNNDATVLTFTAEELAGVPFETRATFTQERGGYLVTTKYPDYFGVMEYASLPETRKKMFYAFINRQAEKNLPLLEEAIRLRKEIATILGYDSYVDYKTDGRMAQNRTAVIAFLHALKEPLRQKTKNELEELLTLKKKTVSDAVSLDPWDLLYYTNQLKRERYGFDLEEIRRYFPANETITAMFSQFSSLFAIRFERVDAPCWSPEVMLYKVLDVTSTRTIAFIFCDLYPREGKYSHTMMCPMITGHLLRDGGYAVPVSAIIGNMRAPEGETPSLLSIDDLEGLFHEFGHILHHSLTTVPYGSLAGTNTEWDFVETPSQLLEEWIYDPAELREISGHYTDRKQKLPKDMVQKIIASREADMGQSYASRHLLAELDISSYDAEETDLTNLYDRLYQEMYGITPPKGGHYPGTIGHYMGGYDAGYYSYLWSKVYALCLLERFRQEGMNNPKTGADLRHWILEQGNIQDGMDLLRGFLGEEPNVQALFTYLDIRRM